MKTELEIIAWLRYLPDMLKYVLDDSNANKDYGNYLSRCFCRYRGHPAGVWFFNVNGLEPDMHCKECGEDLG